MNTIYFLSPSHWRDKRYQLFPSFFTPSINPPFSSSSSSSTLRFLSGNVAVCHAVTSSIPTNDRWQCLSQRRDTYFRQLSLVLQTDTLYMMDGWSGRGGEERGGIHCVLSEGETKQFSWQTADLTQHSGVANWCVRNPEMHRGSMSSGFRRDSGSTFLMSLRF